MNSEIYSRLYSLFDELCLDLSDGSDDRGELAGYVEALSLAENELDRILKNCFAQTADEEGLCMLLSLVDKKQQSSIEQSRELVVSSFNSECKFLNKSTFTTAVTDIDADIEVFKRNDNIMLRFSSGINYEKLKKLGRFYKSNLPASCGLNLSGTGADFDYWENMGLSWFQLDSIGLPFFSLETIKQPPAANS